MSDALPYFRPEDYICTTCGGFLKLPLHFQFPRKWRRWCLCNFDALFDFFIQAEEESRPEEEEQGTPSFSAFLERFLSDEEAKKCR